MTHTITGTAANTTVGNLTTAKLLMETYGRERFISRSNNGYCPLGAIAAARGFSSITAPGGQFESHVYDNTPEAWALAYAIESAYPSNQHVSRPPFYQPTTVVHCWNDETKDDAKVFKIFDDAIAWAKIKEAA